MRQVIISALDEMASPIRHVMKHIHIAMVNIAPEKRVDFDRTYDDFTLEYVDSHIWICDVNVEKKHIRVSRKVMEVLWAASFAYFRLYEAVQKKTVDIPSKAVTIVFADDPSLKDASDLLRYAMDSWANQDASSWPDSLPKPVPNPERGSDEAVADELSLCAIAVILHHELAHIRLEHNGSSKLDSERDADITASEWIFEGLDDESSPVFLKRSLGLAVAMETMVAYGVHTKKYGGTSHPRSFDRLINAMERHIHENNHPAWFFVATILKLHLDNVDHGAIIPDGPFESGRECVDAYVDALSRVSV